MKAKHLIKEEETQELELLLPPHLRRQPDYNEDEFYKGMSPKEIMSQFYYEAAMDYDLKDIDLDDKPAIRSVVSKIKADPEVRRAIQKYGKGHFSGITAYQMVLQAAWMQKPYDGTDWEDTKWANNPGIDLLEEDWKSNERNHGVKHEINNFEISIGRHGEKNPRVWKILPGKGPDGSPEQIREQDRIDRMCKNKTETSGKSWSWKLTSAAPTITEKQISMPSKFSPGDEVRVKNHPELQGVLVKLLSNNAALVNFEISDEHEPVESEVDVIDLEPATLHEQDVEEKLDANQRRAGQAGPKFKPKGISVLGNPPAQHPFKGKLVGGGLE